MNDDIAYVNSSIPYDPYNNTTLDQYKEYQLKKLANIRYNQEIKGIIYNGIPISTTRDAQMSINSLALQVMSDNDYVIDYKTDNGFITLDSKMILEIAKKVREYVQSCYNREKILSEKIKRATNKDDIKIINWEEGD